MTHKIAVDIGSGQEAIVTIRFGVTTSFLRKAPMAAVLVSASSPAATVVFRSFVRGVSFRSQLPGFRLRTASNAGGAPKWTSRLHWMTISASPTTSRRP